MARAGVDAAGSAAAAALLVVRLRFFGAASSAAAAASTLARSLADTSPSGLRADLLAVLGVPAASWG